MHDPGTRHRLRPFALLAALALAACTGDSQNKFQRIGVQFIDGDYRVTFAEGTHQHSWTVRDGKVTSVPEKGYYFFWAEQDGRRIYVQTPIDRTYIEEIGGRP